MPNISVSMDWETLNTAKSYEKTAHKGNFSQSICSLVKLGSKAKEIREAYDSLRKQHDDLLEANRTIQTKLTDVMLSKESMQMLLDECRENLTACDKNYADCRKNLKNLDTHKADLSSPGKQSVRKKSKKVTK